MKSRRARPHSQQSRGRSRQNGGLDRFVRPRDAHPMASFDLVVDRGSFEHGRVQALRQRPREVCRFYDQWLAISHPQAHKTLHDLIGHQVETRGKSGRRFNRDELQDTRSLFEATCSDLPGKSVKVVESAFVHRRQMIQDVCAAPALTAHKAFIGECRQRVSDGVSTQLQARRQIKLPRQLSSGRELARSNQLPESVLELAVQWTVSRRTKQDT